MKYDWFWTGPTDKKHFLKMRNTKFKKKEKKKKRNVGRLVS